MSLYTIKPLRLGTIKRPLKGTVYGIDTDEEPYFPIISYYLESPTHKIVVDTGGIVPDGIHWEPYTRNEDQEPGNALKKLGVSADDIDMVIFTHLHWDHACSNDAFKNARFIVQKKEYDFVADPETSNKGYEAELVLRTTYETVDGDVEIVPGISVVLTPGHSVGSQCILIDTADGTYMITGDTVPLYRNWESSPRVPTGIFSDLDTILRSYEKLGKLQIGGKILPGHEMKVFDREVYP
ncbi:MAG: N-acyl homoserine lactonase family protein [Clostridiales Family XIII bacterium]|jgi:glyoxylase-like metal-dependent hydrolase (beta-lactamase superfamily II)|nr:N-acyl homoserine lactonase family protein [Clostridiales Family XIII bacterium]